MYRIGIIGAQSKHAEFFAALFNKEKRFSQWRVNRICAVDEPQRLPYVLSCAPIPQVDADPVQTIQQSDAVLITTRLASTHFDYAKQALLAGKSVFVDKPFAETPDQVRKLAEYSRTGGALLFGGSTLCFDLQLNEKTLQCLREASRVVFRYRADPESPFGGYAFYLSHLTDLCCRCMGGNYLAIQVDRQADHIVSRIRYAQGQEVTLESFMEYEAPEILWQDEMGEHKVRLDENNCYANGMQAFLQAVERAKQEPAPLDYLAESVGMMQEIVRQSSI